MPNEWLASIRDGAGEAGRFVWDVSRHYAQFHRTAPDSKASMSTIHRGGVRAGSASLYGAQGPVRVLTSGIATGQTIQKPSTMRVPAPDWDDRPAQSVCIAWMQRHARSV